MNLARTGLSFSLAIVASAAFAHGDDRQTMAKHAFDATKVEQRAFGREGDPRKVSRTIQVDMSDGFRFTPSDVVLKRNPGHLEAGMIGKVVVK